MAETRKRGPGKPFQKGGDERRNSGGRPKNAESVTYWIREFGGMTTSKVASVCKLYAKKLREHDSGDLPLASVLAVRVWVQLLDDPTPGLFSELMDRIDGKVTQKQEVIEYEGGRKHAFDHGAAIAAIEERSESDSESSGED